MKVNRKDQFINWLGEFTRKPVAFYGFLAFPLVASVLFCAFCRLSFVDLVVYVLGSEGTILVAFAFTASAELPAESQARRYGRVVCYFVERLFLGLVLLLAAAFLNALR